LIPNLYRVAANKEATEPRVSIAKGEVISHFEDFTVATMTVMKYMYHK
jgi:hypothetical protein